MGATVKYLFWCDLEMTGKSEDDDFIMEIAVLLTTVEAPYTEITRYVRCIKPEDPCWQDRMDSIVVDMHTENGLIDDIETEGISLRQAEQELVNLLAVHGRPHSFQLAGSAVSHSEHKFLKAHMPGLTKWLQHPSFDIGHIRRALKYAGRPDLIAYGHTFREGASNHRGLDDISDHINEWRHYASIFESIERDI